MIIDFASPSPLISICIANYNGIGIVEDCLRSILEQQGNLAIEILMHDDASTDGSAYYVRTNYPSVKLICSDNNVGFCIANNRLTAAATGQYVLLLNNDAALFPDALLTLLTEARRLDQPAILTLPQFDATSGALVDRGCLLDPFFNPVPNLDPMRTDVAMVIGACLWIPKILWDEMEGFPDWFGSIAEDMYLCCRVRLAGYPVRALTTSGYKHWRGKSFGGGPVREGRLLSTFRRRALSERNKTFVMATTCPTPFLQLLLPIHLMLLLVEGTLLSLLRLDAGYLRRIYLPVFTAIWKGRQAIRAKRSIIICSRRMPMVDLLAGFSWMPYKLQMLWLHGLPRVR